MISRHLTFLVAISAFALNRLTIECFNNPVTPEENSFSYPVIHIRRVVEQAFGILKGRFHTLIHNSIRNLRFAAAVAVVAGCLQTSVEDGPACPFEQRWVVGAAQYARAHPGANNQNVVNDMEGEVVRNGLASYVQNEFPI